MMDLDFRIITQLSLEMLLILKVVKIDLFIHNDETYFWSCNNEQILHLKINFFI